MTLTDPVLPTLYRELPGKKSDGDPVALAFILADETARTTSTIRVSWSDMAAARFQEIARQASASDLAEGRNLPYASLRACFETAAPEASLISRDLAAPWSRSEQYPFIELPEDRTDRLQALCSALKTWTSLVLRPWATRLTVSEQLVDGIADIASPERAFVVANKNIEMGSRDVSFDLSKSALLQVIASRLEGQELFPGLGPVFRVIRSSSASNTVKFQTWPVSAPDGERYSMSATISVETFPYLDRPALVVQASRRPWADKMPEGFALRGRGEVTVSLMSKAGRNVAIEIAAKVIGGKIDEPCSPEFLIQALNVRADLASPLSEMVVRRDPSLFIGIPHSTAFGARPVGAGVTTRDHLDLFDTIGVLIADDGFKPIPFTETVRSRRGALKRAVDPHEGLKREALVAHVALDMGVNDISAETLAQTCLLLVDGVTPPAMDPEKAERQRESLEMLRAANAERIHRAFGDTVPCMALVARTKEERDTMRLCVEALFGRSVTTVEYPLPPDTHGPRPAGPAKAPDRFNTQCARWMPLAETLRAVPGGCHVLVQARDFYQRQENGRNVVGRDDPVNKLAGRHALASVADANAQYLLPPGSGWHGFGVYLNRIQSAAYDLMFGHSGLVSEVGGLLAWSFPHAETRPQSIIGISVVAQARLRYGARGGKVCLATRIDAGTSRTQARIGWWAHGAMRWSADWVPFSQAMKDMSQIPAELGPDRATERDSFQKFLGEILDGAARVGDRPLVLVDSTSAAGLWPWLADRGIRSSPLLGVEPIGPERWPGIRLVRIRLGRAPRVLARKTVRYEAIGPDGEIAKTLDRYMPTATARTVTLSEGLAGARHYLVTSGYFQTKFPRGLSVYRNIPALISADKIPAMRGLVVGGKKPCAEARIDLTYESYRVPQAIDVTVAMCQPTSSTSAFIDRVVAQFETANVSPHITLNPSIDTWTPPTRKTSVAAGALELMGMNAVPRVTKEASDEKGHAGSDDGKVEHPATKPVDINAPILPLPEFLTAQWLGDKLTLPYSIARAVHARRNEFKAECGFQWPDEMPSIEELQTLLVEGFRYPGFVWTLRRIGRIKKPGYQPFGPLIKHVSRILHSTSKRRRLPLPSSVDEVIQTLLHEDAIDEAKGVLIETGATDGVPKEWVDNAREQPALADLLPWLEAAEKAMSNGWPPPSPKTDWSNPADEIVETGDNEEDSVPEHEKGRSELAVQNLDTAMEEAENKVEAMTEIPVAAQATSSVAPSADKALSNWGLALMRLGEISKDATGSLPHDEILAEIEEAVSRIRDALAEWRVSGPILVDAAPACSRLAMLEAEFVKLLPGEEPLDFPKSGHMTLENSEAVDRELDAVADDRVVTAILNAKLPVVPVSEIKFELENVVRGRKRDGSFVAAKMLAETAGFLGVTICRPPENGPTSSRTVGVCRKLNTRIRDFTHSFQPCRRRSSISGGTAI